MIDVTTTVGHIGLTSAVHSTPAARVTQLYFDLENSKTLKENISMLISMRIFISAL